VEVLSSVSVDLAAFNWTASWSDIDFRNVNVMVISKRRHEPQRIRTYENILTISNSGLDFFLEARRYPVKRRRPKKWFNVVSELGKRDS